MQVLVSHLDKACYAPRCYVVASTDTMGAKKALTAEQTFSRHVREADVRVHRIHRSREVGQSYFTSIWTTLVACWAALTLVWKERPELVLVNGPGTCIPICFAAVLFRWLMWRPCRVVYVESIARVAELSLSAKILYHMRMADAIFVQWEALQQRYPRCLYAGRLF